jgi:hypothetical protein
LANHALKLYEQALPYVEIRYQRKKASQRRLFHSDEGGKVTAFGVKDFTELGRSVVAAIVDMRCVATDPV